MNSLHPFTPSLDPDSTLSDHDRIARRAQEIWRELGCPQNQDLAIWLEAEAEVHAVAQKTFRHPRLPTST
jgi:hypothetical protein